MCPSCATFALQQCARDNSGNFNPEVIQTILRNLYVSDCLNSDQDAIQITKDLTSLCATGGFKLNMHISNRRSLLLSIPEQIEAKEMKGCPDLDQDILPIERALGVQWCTQSDSFVFKIQQTDKANIEAIEAYPTPSNIKGLQHFQRLAGWYHWFVPHLLACAAP